MSVASDAVRLIVPDHPRSRDPPAVPSAAATVLLVDREALYRWFVAESLRGCAVDVVPCGSLAEASTALRGAVAPDLVMVDGEMLEGRDAASLRDLRAQTGVAPCLVLDSGGDVSASRLEGVTVVAKPVDSAAVVALVTGQLHRDTPAA